jgi:hypothetical protein
MFALIIHATGAANMQVTQTYHPATRTAVHYTARHRHHLPSGGYTDWSEGVANGRHSHEAGGVDEFGHVADCVGSPVHRHAWSAHRLGRKEHGYTSGPLLERALVPAFEWLQRVFSR